MSRSRFVFAPALLCLCAPVWANLVTNGGFEEVGGTPTGSPGPLTGWTAGDTGVFMIASSAFPHSGSWAAALGSTDVSLGTLSQTLTTVAGQEYRLEYWLYNIGLTPNYFNASWDGSIVTGSELTDDMSQTVGTYKMFVFTDLVASGASTNLTFTATNDFGYWHLDDVSVTAPVPEADTRTLYLFAGIAIFAAYKRRRTELRSKLEGLPHT